MADPVTAGPVTAGPAPQVSNWGRWGDDDERGALNRITPEATLRGLARADRSSDLARPPPFARAGPVAERRPSVQHFMVRDGVDYAAGLGERGFGFADDTLVLPTGATTHLDALAHVWADHQMWNGFSASEVTSRGAARCGIDKAGPIVTRALFVDAGPPDGTSSSDDHKLTADDLQRARPAGSRPHPVTHSCAHGLAGAMAGGHRHGRAMGRSRPVVRGVDR